MAESVQPPTSIADVIVFAIHTKLIQGDRFQYLGTKAPADQAQPKNSLDSDWASDGAYTLTYSRTSDKQKIVLRAVTVGNQLMAHAHISDPSNPQGGETFSLPINTGQFSSVSFDLSSMPSALTALTQSSQWDGVEQQIRTLIGQLLSHNAKASSAAQLAWAQPNLILHNACDAAVFAIHAVFVDAGFSCIGLEEPTLAPSSALPSQWNALDPGATTRDVYGAVYLREYKGQRTQVVVKVLVVGDNELLMHAMETSTEQVHSAELKANELIGESEDLTDYAKLFSENAFAQAKNKLYTSAGGILTRREPPAKPSQDLRRQPEQQPDDPYRAAFRPQQWHPPGNPLEVGRSDRFPTFGSGVGGDGSFVGPDHPMFGGGEFVPGGPMPGGYGGGIGGSGVGGVPLPGMPGMPGQLPGRPRIYPTGPLPRSGFGPRGFGDPDPDHEQPPGRGTGYPF